jgi:4a-hydroxytetrahydrobiopterin dehydratase
MNVPRETFCTYDMIGYMNKNEKSTELEINEFLSRNAEWVFTENSLQANFEFSDFDDAMHIVAKVAVKANELNHHPFWSNEYNKLSFNLCTHETGNTVTILDIKLAEAICEIIQKEAGE